MPQYNSPARPPQLLQKGVPAYLFGNLNMLQGNALGYVVDTALAANVGSVTVQINQGPIPLVGDLLTVVNTSQQTGLFNVTRAVITATNINAATGTGTLSYALTGTNQSVTADPGSFISEPGESSEALTTNTFSVPVTVQAPQGDSQFTLPLSVTCPSLPTAATFTLQRAIRDIAAEYTNTTAVVTIAAGVFTAGPCVLATLERGYVYRLAVTGVSGGTNPTVVAKVG